MTAKSVLLKQYNLSSQTWEPFTGGGGVPTALDISFNLDGLGTIHRSFLINQ
jgi:hypothetical protein